MYRPYRENPSFSSSLLDEIYRSIDQRDDRQEEVTLFQKNTNCKQSSFAVNNRETALFDKWAEPVTCKKAVTRKQSPPDFKTGYNSSSSSSDSSCGGGFSSSETESVYGFPSKPKPIRTTSDRHDKYSYNTREKDKQCNYKYNQKYQFDDFQAKPKHEGKFVNKTKSRAMKIYGDLKKVKQPISPGGRLATFLNSIFATNNNTKKIPQSLDSKSANNVSSSTTTTCSSASSYSRSCLSKTPSSSSRGKLNTSMKRSVRFYLDTEPSCDIFIGLNQDYKNDKTRQVEEAARNLLRNYQKKVECEFELSSNNVKSYNVMDMKYGNDEDDDEDDEDDDVASHASSDLFELENLSAIGIGMGKYGDELPVYETTHLDMNLAIGNGFLM